MSDNPYKKFFTEAQAVKRGEAPVDKVKFRLKSKPRGDSPEQNEKRLRQAVKVKTKKRNPFPWKSLAGLVVTIVAVAGYVAFPDRFEAVFNKFEIRALGAAEAADKDNVKPPADAAEKSTSTGAGAEKVAADAAKAGPDKKPEGKGTVSEELSHYEKLKQRKEELDAREKELNDLEEELQKQKVELDKRISQLEEIRNQIGQTLKDRVEVDQEKVNKLVDLYSNMKPKQAADVLGSLNEELAVEVLAKMKKKNAAEIMNLLSPEKARVLSEKYTGYRRISSQDPKG